MKPFSLDLRQRVLADYQAGLSFAELGRKYTTSAEWVRQFLRRYEATGEIAARPPRIKKVPFHRRHEAELREALAAQSDLTLEGLRAKLRVDVSIGTLWNALRALKISFKKKRSWRPSSNGRTSPPRARNSGPCNASGWTRTASSSSMKRGSKPT
jgi:transposase